MKAKIFFVALLFIVFSAATLWAGPDNSEKHGGFYGTVTYVNCTCDTYDRVSIEPASGGDPSLFYLERCGGQPGYTTSPTTFVQGYYYIGIVKHQGSDCDHTFVQLVQHGSFDQEVNLTIYGPDGGGSGPSGP
jgi:hypothetical protein